MSVIVTTRDQVARSPINSSTAKQLFSFSKGARFQPPRKTHELDWPVLILLGATSTMIFPQRSLNARLRSALAPE